MRPPSIALSLLLLCGCTNESHGRDGGALADAAAGADAALGGDAGIDCSVIGCGAPVACGEICNAPCGCCPCGEEAFCDASDLVECVGGCYQRTACGGDGCVEGVAGPACAAPSCPSLEAEYLARIAQTACGADADCHLVDGHCGVGLGGCYHAVSGDVTQAELDAIAAEWTALRCDVGRPVCDCAPRPDSVQCATGACVAP